MVWQQVGKRVWCAVVGEYQFIIELSGGKFWPRYSSCKTSCKLNAHKKLKDAKAECEKASEKLKKQGENL